jgi:hypothetical protein
MKLIIEEIQVHRNGICGAPFHVLLFRDPDEGRMLGIVFQQEYHVAVLNIDKSLLLRISPLASTPGEGIDTSQSCAEQSPPGKSRRYDP